MRVSVDPTDPSYNTAHFGAKVFLDGAEIGRVITADEEKRFVLAYRADEKGDAMLTPDRENLQTEFRYGAVRIDLPAVPCVPRIFE